MPPELTRAVGELVLRHGCSAAARDVLRLTTPDGRRFRLLWFRPHRLELWSEGAGWRLLRRLDLWHPASAARLLPTLLELLGLG